MANTTNTSGEMVSYADGEQPLAGYWVKSASAKENVPGVLVLPAWKGVDEHGKTSARELAVLGYHALVADIYGLGGRVPEMQEAMELVAYYRKNFEVYQARIKAALDELVRQGADPQNLAIIGYCFGGTGVLEAVRAGLPVRGVVSFHGGLAKDEARPNGPVKAKVLVLHGADDPHVSPESVTALMQEMREGEADWQMIWYGGAVHSFSDPNAGNDKSKGAAYDAVAARRSWEHMTLFLKELFES